jgi:hypothetical protein
LSGLTSICSKLLFFRIDKRLRWELVKNMKNGLRQVFAVLGTFCRVGNLLGT